MKTKYTIPLVWVMMADATVYAENEAEAIKLAMSSCPEDLDGEYVEDSLEVNDECLEALQPVDKKTDDFHYTGVPDIDMRRVIQMEANRIYSDRS